MSSIHRLFVTLGLAVGLLAFAPTTTSALPAASGTTSAPESPAEKFRRGLVLIERGGKISGAGLVLSEDGRILTSLSCLATDEAVDIRYADGTTARAILGHKDEAWDLALVIPQTGKWSEGLRASERLDTHAELRAVVPLKNAAPLLLTVRNVNRGGVRSPHGQTLADAFEIEARGASAPGAPIVDKEGLVVAMFARGCAASVAEGGPCQDVSFGVPITVIRSFLMRTPKDAVRPPPWLGIVGFPEATALAKGVRVAQVAPGSPAEKAGLDSQPPDVIVAIEGEAVDAPEKLGSKVSARSPGDAIKLLVLRGTKFREVSVILGVTPPAKRSAPAK